jgi:hypothetical protein
MSALVVRVVFDRGGEEGVNEGSFSKSGFASNLEVVRIDNSWILRSRRPGKAYHNSESSSSLCDNLVSLIW